MNFLPKQYENTNKIQINHNYLKKQFKDNKKIFNDIKKVVEDGDFTLGKTVDEFEEKFSEVQGVKYSIGVGSGTDAIFLSLIAAGIEKDDEVITTPFTFYATVGAIVTAGAKPVFVDAGEDYNIDVTKIEEAITKRTKVILPVHWSGKICNMKEIKRIAKKYNLMIIEDACHAIKASYNGSPAGGFGIAGAFSMHPLKNLNIWGDGGVICTNNKKFMQKLKLMRNHGLMNRDTCKIFGYNSRLDTIQAVVAKHMLKKIDFITNSRIHNSQYLDNHFCEIPQIVIPKRNCENIKQVFHIYSVKCKNRDKLQKFLIKNDIDAKIHYPVPMHLQPAARYLGYKKGDFPISENLSKTTISFPVHEFISKTELKKIVSTVKNFYK